MAHHMIAGWSRNYIKMITTPLCHKIFVRYARKAIWMPTAPSKLFRIPEHTFYSQEENVQIKCLQKAYVAQENSIKEFMRLEFYIPASQSGGLPKEFLEREQEKDKLLYKENEEENEKIAELKKVALDKRKQELEEQIKEEKAKRELQLIEMADEVDKKVRELKADPDSFVTSENIDAIIDKAMENPVSFQFYMDTSGREYRK